MGWEAIGSYLPLSRVTILFQVTDPEWGSNSTPPQLFLLSPLAISLSLIGHSCLYATEWSVPSRPEPGKFTVLLVQLPKFSNHCDAQQSVWDVSFTRSSSTITAEPIAHPGMINKNHDVILIYFNLVTQIWTYQIRKTGSSSWQLTVTCLLLSQSSAV